MKGFQLRMYQGGILYNATKQKYRFSVIFDKKKKFLKIP